jgi:hypothetical protein
LRQLFLHIGFNKTGTSAIQRFLSTHGRALGEARVRYPVTGRGGDAHYGLTGALGFAHRKSASDPSDDEYLRKALVQEMEVAQADTAIVSSEDFVLRGDIGRVRTFFADFDCRIVVYLRRHDYWWISSYNQAVKMVAKPPWKPGINAYIEFCRERKATRASYRELLDRWADAFGVEAVIVRPFEAAQNEGGVVADFLRSVGLFQLADEAASKPERVNESLAFDTLHILDLVQRANISSKMRESLKNLLIEDRSPGSQVQSAPMHPKLRRRLIDENRADYDYIARTFLGRSDGILFTEPEPRGDESWEAPPKPNKVQVVTKIINLLDKGA